MGAAGRQGAPSPALHFAGGAGHRTHSRLAHPAPCPGWAPQEENGPHSPLHSLGSHQERHEVSPRQLLPGHEGAPNKQGAQDHACKGAGQVVREGAGGQSLAPVPVPAPLPTDWRFSKAPEWSLPFFLWQQGRWGHLTASSQQLCPWLRCGTGPVCPLPA